MEGNLESLGAGTGLVEDDDEDGATSLSGEAKLTAVRESSAAQSGFFVGCNDLNQISSFNNM